MSASQRDNEEYLYNRLYGFNIESWLTTFGHNPANQVYGQILIHR